MARISARMTGGIMIIFAILVLFHWYLVHLVKFFAGDESQLIPELGIAVFGLFIIGILIISGKLKIKGWN